MISGAPMLRSVKRLERNVDESAIAGAVAAGEGDHVVPPRDQP